MKHIPEIIKQAAKNLRNNSTQSEVILWNHIKQEKLWVKFLRQKPIYVYTENNWLDRFIIADFYCHDKKLVIEVDGRVHEKSDVYKLDRIKEELLIKQGISVLRIKNIEIEKDMHKVLEKINISLF